VGTPTQGLAVRRLDLDDVGAGLRHQQRRTRPLEYLAEIKDDDAGKRQVGMVGHAKAPNLSGYGTSESVKTVTRRARIGNRGRGEALGYHATVADNFPRSLALGGPVAGAGFLAQWPISNNDPLSSSGTQVGTREGLRGAAIIGASKCTGNGRRAYDDSRYYPQRPHGA